MTLHASQSQSQYPSQHPSLPLDSHAQITPTPSLSTPARPHATLSGSELDTPRQVSTFPPALSFATRSWDLATGGLKTLTAKRVLPLRSDRPKQSKQQADDTTSHYLLLSVLLLCLIFLLFGGGLVLFVLYSS